MVLFSGSYPRLMRDTSVYDTTVELPALLEAMGALASDADKALIRDAYAFATKAHEGQKRMSGAPYLSHVTWVAQELAQMGLDGRTVAAALLHDCVEDSGVSLETLSGQFGAEIAGLVDGVTKISTRTFKSFEERQAENLRKMLVAMAKDIRVLLIKLSDRLHNLRTIRFLPEDKQQRICRETLDVYAPLAHRLGIAKWKWEMEDRSMAVLNPESFQSLWREIEASLGNRQNLLEQARLELENHLASAGIKAEVSARSKHTYSIYQKMLKQHKSLEEIYDLMGLRVITRSIHDCYAALGIVHAEWKPVPGRVKDYIAMPKSNMYQSLHTTVIGPGGHPLEIQVRTSEMHRTAERGIAAHWVYKEGERKAAKPEAELNFFSMLSEWQKDLKDTREFMEFLKIDLYEDEVFVFTPTGEVRALPKGSTPIDFAYEIHSNLGDHTYGAKVNGKMVPLRYELTSGDIVEIVSAANRAPSKDWLPLVKTSKAKNRIRHFFKIHEQEQFTGLGREMLEKECAKESFQLHDLFKSPQLLEAAKRFSLASIEDLLAAVGQRRISPKHVLAALRPEAVVGEGRDQVLADAPRPAEIAAKSAPGTSVSEGVEVKGLSQVLVTFARCCTPLPGDPILGFVTVGRGVSVHRTDCVNAADLSKKTERLVEVSWSGAAATARPLELVVAAYDRSRLMSDMLLAISETKDTAGAKTAMKAASAKSGADGMASAEFTVLVENLEHLRRIMLNLYKVEGVTSVKRKEKVK